VLTVFLGLASSLSYAISDMLSQRASRAADVLRIVFWVLVVGVVLVVPVALIAHGLPHGHEQWHAAGLAAIAGVGYVGAYFALLVGLRRGDLSLVAALSATQGAFVALWAMLTGEHLTALVGAGLALAIVGGTLSAVEGRAKTTAGAGWALLSAALFAVVVVLYDHAGALPSLSVAAVSRTTSFLAIVPVVLLIGGGVSIARPLRLTVAGAGALEILGLVFVTASVAVGPLAIAGVMISQFATFAVLLGIVFLRERPRPHQLFGVACTIAAVSVLALR
jgi:drug/metabolite transporter (DMT)-like permease